MKNKLALAAALVFAVVSARASVIWYEGFQYPNGSIAATSGILTNINVVTNSVSGGLWFRPPPFNGSANPDDAYVVNSNLQVTATGGSVISRQDDPIRYFATASGTPTNAVVATYSDTSYNIPQVLYASFTLICSTTISNGAGLPNGVGSYFASFYSATNYGTPFLGYGYFGRVQAFTNGTVLGGTWRLGVTDNAKTTNNGTGFPVDLAVNTPYQVVEELDPITLQAATIWVNPININQTGSSPVDPHYTASDALGNAITYGVNAYAFRQGSSFGNAAFQVTNLCIATTFAEAATNVWSTNAVSPVVVYQPAAATSNFVGSTFSISAVANGQGLGSLTYQWQKSATPNNANPSNVSNPNGNSNIFGFVNAQTTDTGYYTMIVTTPWGLSATSAVAQVVISAAPVPPTFVTQPASTTAFTGQKVILTASVDSPGNVAFTWYSNNIPVTAGVSGSGDSSQLELDNVTPANSATYYVAATNDVVVNGVVSSNAVVTILNPPAVSIHYLRSLVDPNTYLATNTPPSIPYQVTGIITTLTNITTGDTASYYLQDGTGGINIFVTGGSTFRPALGDVVTFIGVVSSYTTGLELYADSTVGSAFPYTSYTDLSNNIAALPAPLPIPYTILNNPSNANYNLGAMYVQISDVYFGGRSGTPTSTSANDFVSVTNSAGQVFNVMFPYLDQNVAGQTLPNYAYTVSGVLFSTASIVTNVVMVTRWSDVVTTPASIPILTTGSAAANNYTLYWNGSVFTLQSATSVTGPYADVPSAASPYVVPIDPTIPTKFYRLRQ